MDLPVIITLVVTAAGATWALRSKLSDVESALKDHAAADAANFKEIRDNVVQLRTRRNNRR